MRRIRVLLADDHRAGPQKAFARLLEPDCDVVGAVADGRALLEAAVALRPDVVVLDIGMPRLLNGLDAGRQLKLPDARGQARLPDGERGPRRRGGSLPRAGASGYLLKNSAASELLEAIEAVSQGRSYVTPLATQGLVGSSPATSRRAARRPSST